jgi:predicted HTH domain antitoxin
MTKIPLEVPDSLGEYKKDTVRFIAAKLYESGKLSLGQAADMAALTKRTFAELLNDYHVSYINYSVDDLKDELDGLTPARLG